MYKRNNILIIHKSFIQWGGAERFCIQEYKNLKKLGFNVKILIFKIDKSIFNKYLFEIKQDIYLLNSCFFLNMIKAIIFIKKFNTNYIITGAGIIETFIYSFLTGTKYIIHMHHPSFMEVDTDVYRFRKNKIFDKLSTLYSSGKEIKERRKKISFLKLIYFRTRSILSINSYKFAYARIVWSEYHRKEKLDLYGIDSRVIQGGFSDKEFRQVRPKKPRKVKKDFIILSVCRLHKNKRVELAIKSFSLLNSKDIFFKLIIVGKGPDENKLKNLVKENKLKNIIFKGLIPDSKLKDIYKSANLFLALDIGDFKLNMHEALLFHMPVLTTEETAISNELKKTNYVFTSNPEESSIAKQIKFISKIILNKPNKFDSKKLEIYLEKMTWENYFRIFSKLMDN